MPTTRTAPVAPRPSGSAPGVPCALAAAGGDGRGGRGEGKGVGAAELAAVADGSNEEPVLVIGDGGAEEADGTAEGDPGLAEDDGHTIVVPGELVAGADDESILADELAMAAEDDAPALELAGGG